MIKITLLFIIASISLTLNAQVFLQIPIEGTQGEDWIIVNYVDWDTIGIKDFNCSTKTYDGHQGTDFVIRSFQDMDDSVAVHAATAGIVTFTVDTIFDRETISDIDKGLGNYIALSHANDFYTYYGHLMQNSVQFEVGDSVEAGALIGFVGSSGNSTDPHLHFELWYDSLYIVDPFAGDCGNEVTRFIDPPTYDSSLTVWESGLHLKNDLTINDLRERIVSIDKPYSISVGSDSMLYFWSHMYGLRKDKELSIKWFTPDNLEWFDYSFSLDRDYWYYYYWSFINHQDLVVGDWTVRLYYDGMEIANEIFEVNDEVTSLTKLNGDGKCQEYKSWSYDKLISSDHIDVNIFNVNGQQISKNELPDLPSGIHLLQIRNGDQNCILKRWIE